MVVGSVLVGRGDWDSPAPCGIRNLRLWLGKDAFELAYFGCGITDMCFALPMGLFTYDDVMKPDVSLGGVRCHPCRSGGRWSQEWPRLLPRRC